MDAGDIALTEVARSFAPARLGVVDRLIRIAAASVGSRPSELYGYDCRWPLCHARFAVWVILREQGWSYPRIGAACQRDQSTIRSGVLSARLLMARPGFVALLGKLRGAV